MNVLITGGASGLGAAITRRLGSKEENKIFFTYFKSRENASQMEQSFPNTQGIQVDFNNIESLAKLKNLISKESIDILINNAIVEHTKNHFHKIAPEYFSQSFLQNINPTLEITAEAIKVFRKKKFGKIITILSSGLINTPPVGWSEYTANKAYLHSMVKSWATENASFNITSNGISPSMMMTDLNDDIDERYEELATDAHPLKKLLSVDEVADSVNFLCEATQQINGINMIINSGVNIL